MTDYRAGFGASVWTDPEMLSVRAQLRYRRRRATFGKAECSQLKRRTTADWLVNNNLLRRIGQSQASSLAGVQSLAYPGGWTYCKRINSNSGSGF